MPNNPKVSSRISAYVDRDLRRRAEIISQRNPRMTLSRIVEECVDVHLSVIEKRVAEKTAKKSHAA